MSLTYYIDGYNLLWSTDQFGSGSLRAQREKLLLFLEKVPLSIVVIFDGRDHVSSPPWMGKVQVLFSSSAGADSMMKSLIDQIENPRSAIVVSNDRAIQHWVRGARAKVMECSDFLQGVLKKPLARRGPGKLDAASAADINEEMKKIWKL